MESADTLPPRWCILVHIGAPIPWIYIRTQLAKLKHVHCDLYINLAEGDLADEDQLATIEQQIREDWDNGVRRLHIARTPNQDADIGGFFTSLHAALLSGVSYKYVFKIHTKDNPKWLESMLGELVEAFDGCDRLYEADPTIGMFCPAPWLLRLPDSFDAGMTDSIRGYINSLGYPRVERGQRFGFAAGTLFTMRMDILRTWLWRAGMDVLLGTRRAELAAALAENLRLQEGLFRHAPWLHVAERFFGMLVTLSGFGIRGFVTTNSDFDMSLYPLDRIADVPVQRTLIVPTSLHRPRANKGALLTADDYAAFDPAWYCMNNPDVYRAYKDREHLWLFTCAHWAHFGYREGRLPHIDRTLPLAPAPPTTTSAPAPLTPLIAVDKAAKLAQAYPTSPVKGIQSATSTVYIDDQRRYVVKVLADTYALSDPFAREKHVLGLLSSFDWCPKLLADDGKRTLVMTWAGHRLSRTNVPRDAVEQMDRILSQMEALNLAHGDLKMTELLVDGGGGDDDGGGKLRICDFGWAMVGSDITFGGTFSSFCSPCNLPLREDGKMPMWRFDRAIIKHLAALVEMRYSATTSPLPLHDSVDPNNRGEFAECNSHSIDSPIGPSEPSSFVPFKNTVARHAHSKGSQSESPSLTLTNNTITVSGYQRFTLDFNGTIVSPPPLPPKYAAVKTMLGELPGTCKTVADVGCSAGLVGFLAADLGYNRITCLDHDVEYIDMIRYMTILLTSESISAREYSFGDDFETHDVVVMLALVHWVYSCTASFGSLRKILEYIAPKASKYLILEWIDPTDVAIQSFNHMAFNPAVHSEPYDYDHFIDAIRDYGTVVRISKFDTRYIHLIKRTDH